MCDVEKIDMEKFIMEVEKKPCIWNIRSEEYKDRKRRDTAWREICSTFFPNFAELSRDQRRHVGYKLQLKWRNIRDYYRKYTKKETRSGSGTSKRFKYIFADQLTFLAPLLEKRSAEASGLTDGGLQITEERTEGNSHGTSTSTEPVVLAQTPASSATKPASRPQKGNSDGSSTSTEAVVLAQTPASSAIKPASRPQKGNSDGSSTSTEPVVLAQTPAGSATKPVSRPQTGNSDGTSTSTEPVVLAQTPAGSATKPVSRPQKIKLEPKRNQSHDNCSKPMLHTEFDDDKLFFDSLLSAVHTFDMDQKIEFRCEVLRVLQRVRNTKFLLQRHQYQTPTGQMEYASTSHLPNIYNQGPSPQLCDEESTNFREMPQKQSQNKTPARQSNETEILNTESSESDLSTFSDDNNEMY